jgi:hypothetical protein
VTWWPIAKCSPVDFTSRDAAVKAERALRDRHTPAPRDRDRRPSVVTGQDLQGVSRLYALTVGTLSATLLPVTRPTKARGMLAELAG